jgi:hypothetical protein
MAHMGHLVRYAKVTTLLALMLYLSVSFPTASSAQSFRNCAEIRAKYPAGVARDFSVVFSQAFHVSRTIYRANKRLDVDRDGVICEIEIVAATTSNVPLTTTTTSVPQIPAGNWTNLPFQSGERLLFGRGYRMYVCSNGTSATSLSVQIGTDWVIKASSIVGQEPSLCPDASFPYAHSYFWVVDVRGPNDETAVAFKLNGFTRTVEQTRVIVLSETSLTTTTSTTTTTTTTTTTLPRIYLPSGSSGGSLASATMQWSSVFQRYSLYSYASDAYVSTTSQWSSILERYSVSGSVGSSYVSLSSNWSSILERYSVSGSVGSSYVSLSSNWSSILERYSISGSIGSSYVSLTMRWSSILQQYSISGSIGSSYVSLTMRWSSILQQYSISGTGPSLAYVIIAATTDPIS